MKITHLLDLENQDWYQNHRPLLFGQVDEKYNQLDRAFMLVDMQKAAEPFMDLRTVKRFTFRIATSQYLRTGIRDCDSTLDNQGNEIIIRLCRRPRKAEFQFLWEMNRIPRLEVTTGARLNSNYNKSELRTSVEKQCLTDIIETYYFCMTQEKYRIAKLPTSGSFVKFKDKVHKVKFVYAQDGSPPTIYINAFDIKIITTDGIKIENSLDWEVQNTEDAVTGEVFCSECKIIALKQTLDLKYVKACGYLCGPCRDHLYENGRIKDGMWENTI